MCSVIIYKLTINCPFITFICNFKVIRSNLLGAWISPPLTPSWIYADTHYPCGFSRVVIPHSPSTLSHLFAAPPPWLPLTHHFSVTWRIISYLWGIECNLMRVSHTHWEMPYRTPNLVSHSSECGAWGECFCVGIDTLYAYMTPAVNPQHYSWSVDTFCKPAKRIIVTLSQFLTSATLC